MFNIQNCKKLKVCLFKFRISSGVTIVIKIIITRENVSFDTILLLQENL